jgi:hypothetical protein
MRMFFVGHWLHRKTNSVKRIRGGISLELVYSILLVLAQLAYGLRASVDTGHFRSSVHYNSLDEHDRWR